VPKFLLQMSLACGKSRRAIWYMICSRSCTMRNAPERIWRRVFRTMLKGPSSLSPAYACERDLGVTLRVARCGFWLQVVFEMGSRPVFG